MNKFWLSDLQGRVLDECLQLFGGYGYMMEYPVAEMWTDARVQRIYGGTNEIMKEIIGRALYWTVRRTTMEGKDPWPNTRSTASPSPATPTRSR